ncbi:MAG: hypothetical protein QXQ38_01200 [Archaeoglobaceae archaeon]
MWLRLCSSEDKTVFLEMASELRKMSAKVEIRELVEFEREEQFVLKGKLSEIRRFKDHKELEKKIEKWEKRIKILREALKEQNIKYEDFLENFLNQEDPEGFEFAKRFMNGQVDVEEVVNSAGRFIEFKTTLEEVDYFLLKNGFEIGENLKGSLPEDPEVIITLKEPVEGSKKLITVEYFPVWELYVDVLSLIGEDVENEEIAPILGVISNILVNLEKIEDLDKLMEMCSGIIEDEDREVMVNCGEVFDLIVRALEKSGIVRISGKKIKMRKRQW